MIKPREDLALVPGYHSPQLDVRFRMNTNESPEAPPEAFLIALKEAIDEIPLNRYPDLSALRLREAIGSFHGVAPEEVYCGNGSNEVLQSILLAYGGPGRIAATFEPTYALHAHIARITGTQVIEGERNEEFLIDQVEIDGVIARGNAFSPENPAVIFLCSPNNPTGRTEPASTVSDLIARAPGLLVVDEAYGQFARESAIDLHHEYPRLVVVRTFSKTWSLAALRLGYAIASPEVVAALNAVTLPYHLDALKQLAGRIALQFEPQMLERAARLVEERGRVVSELNHLAVEACPSDANFVLFRINHKDAHAVWQQLINQSVLVRDVSGWERLQGYLRVTIGLPEENNAFLAALKVALA